MFSLLTIYSYTKKLCVNIFYIRNTCDYAPNQYIVSYINCNMNLIVIITKTSAYFFFLFRRLLREVTRDKWSISAQCSFVVQDRVYSIHEKAVPSRNCRRDWPESADRSHDLSFSALSDPPPSEAFASPFLCTSLPLFRVWYPDSEITNYGLINRSRKDSLNIARDTIIIAGGWARIDHRFVFINPAVT